MVIAIDGPAGAGKSTVARELAEALRFKHLESGALYRALAVSLLRHPGSAEERASGIEVELGDRVLVDGEDVTVELRSSKASQLTPQIAIDPGVRAALLTKQRELLAEGDWVAEGRDIGTVVAPDAELKIFLTASPDARARRRARDTGEDWREVLKEQGLRDAQDRLRPHSPLRPAPDAIELDTTDRQVHDVVTQIIGLARERSTV